MWSTNDIGQGTTTFVDGHLICLDIKGNLFLVKPDPTGFKPLASANILKESGITGNERIIGIVGTNQNWSPMALVDGKLLIKSQKRLICVKVAQ